MFHAVLAELFLLHAALADLFLLFNLKYTVFGRYVLFDVIYAVVRRSGFSYLILNIRYSITLLNIIRFMI